MSNENNCQVCYSCEKECGQCYTCQVGYGGEQSSPEPSKKLRLGNTPPVKRPEDAFMPPKFAELTLWNTARCNFSCDYCFVYKLYPNQPSKDMPDEVIEKLPAFLEKYFVPNPNIWFFGGEPLVAWDRIVKVYETVKPKIPNANFGMTTNLSLMDEEKAIWLGKRNFGVLCSIDGGKEAHNKHRILKGGAGTWDMVWRGLQNVRKYININPQIRWTVNPDTVQYLYDDFKFYVSNGLTNLAIEPVYEVKWGEEELNMWADQMEKIAKFMIDSNIQITVKPFQDLLMLFSPQPLEWRSRCGLAQGGIGMDINGKVYYCHRFVATMRDDLTIGDVFKGIDENKRKEVTKRWITHRPYNADNPERCKTCPVKWACFGGCLAVNYDTSGDAHKVPTSYCDIMEINAKRLLPYVLILRDQGKVSRGQY